MSAQRLYLTTLAVLALTSFGCVDAEVTEGSTVLIELRSASPEEATLPLQLDLVVDHVELLRCVPAAPHHLISHLPPAPYRLSSGERWEVITDGIPMEPQILGTLEPVPEDYCGVRVGIYSALPDSPAVHSGIPEGLSFRAHWEVPSALSVQASLGFDIEVRGAPWLEATSLEDGPVTIIVTLELPAHPIEDPRELAQYFVTHSTISSLRSTL